MGTDVFDEGFSPVPVGTEPPDPATTLDLLADLQDPGAVAITQDPPPPLGRTPAFDFATRQLIPGAAGGPLMLTGDATLMQWIDKCLRTRRGENPACDPSFGCVALLQDLLDGSVFDTAAAAQMEDVAREALTVHPRILDLLEWTIDYVDGDDLATVYLTINREGVGGEPVADTLELTLPIGGEVG
jgi:phage baseplate assembly protein W